MSTNGGRAPRPRRTRAGHVWRNWRGRWAAVWATLRLLPSVSRPMTAVVAASVLIGAALPVAFQVASGALVGAVPAAVRDGFGSPAGHRLVNALAVAASLFVAQQMLGPFKWTIVETLGRRLDGNLRLRVMRAALGPPGVGHLEDPKLLDKVSLGRSVGPNEYTPGGVVMGFAGRATDRLASTGSAVLIASFSPLVAMALVATQIIVRMPLERVLLKNIEIIVDQTQAMRRSKYLRDLALTPGAAKETRVFGLGDWLGDRYTTTWLGVMSQVWRERRQGRWEVVLGTLVLAASYGGAFFLFGRAAVRGEISLGHLAVLAQSVFGLSGFGNVTANDLRIKYGAASVPAVHALEQRVASQRDGSARAGPARYPAGLPQDGIRFEGVSFRYPGREQDVYRALDLFIPAGRSLAIVGANGAGKTTLVKLLARLYEPQRGRITVDGVDLREMYTPAWQRRIAAIFQDFVRYEMTAAENVGFGAAEFLGDRRALEEACASSGASEIVATLPKEWDTILSRRFTDGVDLSGGQWQRIALARALFAVRGGASVLVLDEPTANLDVRAEAELFDRFLEVTQGLTTILISHRFSTVRRADHICVLDHGRIVQQGTHDELLAAGGLYAEMFLLQAARFTEDA